MPQRNSALFFYIILAEQERERETEQKLKGARKQKHEPRGQLLQGQSPCRLNYPNTAP